jgi:DNA-binding MarR family transcriptional regulator
MADPRTSRALQLAARALGRLGRELARAGEITPQQAETLQLVVERGTVSTSSLASLLGIDPSTASRNLTGLEREGYVVRRRGADDGRQTDVRLTPRGRRTADAISARWAAAASSLLERTPRAERARIADALRVVSEALAGGDAGE